MRDTPKAPFLQEIGNTDSNQVVCGIQAPPEVIWMCLPTSLKTYPPKQVALSQNGAFPGYYRWVWYATSGVLCAVLLHFVKRRGPLPSVQFQYTTSCCTSPSITGSLRLDWPCCSVPGLILPVTDTASAPAGPPAGLHRGIMRPGVMRTPSGAHTLRRAPHTLPS